eukprot:326249-Amphidinium_carterae.1
MTGETQDETEPNALWVLAESASSSRRRSSQHMISVTHYMHAQWGEAHASLHCNRLTRLWTCWTRCCKQVGPTIYCALLSVPSSYGFVYLRRADHNGPVYLGSRCSHPCVHVLDKCVMLASRTA